MSEVHNSIEPLAASAQCRPAEITTNPFFGVVDESTDLNLANTRIILDATHEHGKAGPNKAIQRNTSTRGQCPRKQDVRHAGTVARRSHPSRRLKIAKIDTKMVHRRVKLLRKDWKNMSALSLEAPTGPHTTTSAR